MEDWGPVIVLKNWKEKASMNSYSNPFNSFAYTHRQKLSIGCIDDQSMRWIYSIPISFWCVCIGNPVTVISLNLLLDCRESEIFVLVWGSKNPYFHLEMAAMTLFMTENFRIYLTPQRRMLALLVKARIKKNEIPKSRKSLVPYWKKAWEAKFQDDWRLGEQCRVAGSLVWNDLRPDLITLFMAGQRNSQKIIFFRRTVERTKNLKGQRKSSMPTTPKKHP